MNARSGRTPIEILSEALTHFEIARSHASRDLEEQITIDAVCMRLSAGVESLSKLDEATRAATFGSSWSAMWGMRNRIAHGYLLIDAGIVRSTAERDIPGIIAQIRRAIEHCEASG